ncbi:hypothetical protein BV20DRAFT_583428 [Pilatotrama ljubarskyi]|nr:hypothetical protein BV20DRAFT_583428 [Pilatotrama ljubarskyi]
MMSPYEQLSTQNAADSTVIGRLRQMRLRHGMRATTSRKPDDQEGCQKCPLCQARQSHRLSPGLSSPSSTADLLLQLVDVLRHSFRGLVHPHIEPTIAHDCSVRLDAPALSTSCPAALLSAPPTSQLTCSLARVRVCQGHLPCPITTSPSFPCRAKTPKCTTPNSLFRLSTHALEREA